MGNEGFGRYGGLRWAWMGWDGCGRGPRTDLNGLGWNKRSGMGKEGLGWVGRAWDSYGGPRVGVQPRNSIGTKDEYGGPDMGIQGFGWMWSA